MEKPRARTRHRPIGQTNGAGRIGEPDEIGYGVLFFASDASSFCSGQTLYMHGAPGPAGV